MASKLLGTIALSFGLLAGCASDQKETTGPTDERRAVDLHIKQHEPAEAKPATREVRPEPAREVVRPEPTRSTEGGLYWTERAYPTGDKRTSVVVLESGTPGEVSVGTPYEYVLRVTNVSDMNLDNVVIVDKPRGNFELRGSQPRTVDGKDLRWELGSLSPKQTKEIRITGAAIGNWTSKSTCRSRMPRPRATSVSVGSTPRMPTIVLARIGRML